MNDFSHRRAQQEEARRERQAKLVAAAKAQRRKALAQKIGIGVGLGVVVVGLLIISVLIFQVLLWNAGVVGLAAACGASVSQISFTTAMGGIVILMALGQLIHGSDVSINRS